MPDACSRSCAFEEKNSRSKQKNPKNSAALTMCAPKPLLFAVSPATADTVEIDGFRPNKSQAFAQKLVRFCRRGVRGNCCCTALAPRIQKIRTNEQTSSNRQTDKGIGMEITFFGAFATSSLSRPRVFSHSRARGTRRELVRTNLSLNIRNILTRFFKPKCASISEQRDTSQQAQVQVTSGFRGPCSGSSKPSEMALLHGIAFLDAEPPRTIEIPHSSANCSSAACITPSLRLSSSLYSLRYGPHGATAVAHQALAFVAATDGASVCAYVS